MSHTLNPKRISMPQILIQSNHQGKLKMTKLTGKLLKLKPTL